MNLEKIFEMLNELQRNALICFIIQLPLCYTFMYMHSDFFVQQDFINKVIFALSLDVSVLTISIFELVIVSLILGRYDTSYLVYLFTGGYIFSFSIYVWKKIENNDVTISEAVKYNIYFLLGIFLTSIIIRVIEYKKEKNVKQNKT